MFRIGGSAGTGITSGLAPRQGYSNGFSAEQIQDLRKQAKELSYQPRKSNDMSRFLIDFGLNVAGATPSGSILSTAAQAAQEPYGRMQQAKSDRERAQYASEADMFKTLFEGAIETRTGGKTYAHRDKASMIRDNMQKQFELQDQLKNLDPDSEEYEAEASKIGREIQILKNAIKSPEFSEAAKLIINDDRERRMLLELITEQVKKENPDITDFESPEFKSLRWAKIKEVMEGLEVGTFPEFKAEGGRMGYQEGMSVMPTAMPAQEETMPEELGGVSYEELRARLPQEVSDEVVRLLANSPEALEDFAVIQTEQDIANFNKKYGVNLVLPAEA